MKPKRKNTDRIKRFRHVFIGARKHKIEYVKSIKNGKHNYAGLYIGNDARILINKVYCKRKDNAVETIVHEILHGALHALGEHSLATNEKFVNKLGMVLAQALLTIK